MSYDHRFEDDPSWVKFKCLEVAKDAGKSPKEIIAAAKEYEKYVLPRAVKLKMIGKKNEKTHNHK